MKEVFNCFSNRLLVINECLHDLCCAMDRNKFIISNCSRDETRRLCRHKYFVACSTDTNGEWIPYIHNDNERVVFYHIPMKRLICLYYLYAEEWSIQEYVGLAHILFMRCLIFWIYRVVDSLCCQFGMQLSRFTIQSRTIVIKDAVSHIRGLLYLSKFNASADGVHTTGGEIEHIALVYLMFCKNVRYGAISYALLVLLRSNLFLKPCIKV